MASGLGIGKIQRYFTATAEIRARVSKAHLDKKLSEYNKTTAQRCTLNESASYWFGYTNCFGNLSYEQLIPIDALDSNEIDLSHLLTFREFVECSLGHYVNWGNISNSILFSSERISNAHAPFGVVSKECFKGGKENYRHIWRGIIDGDGNLGVYEWKDLGRRVPYIFLCSSPQMCSQFRDLKENLANLCRHLLCTMKHHICSGFRVTVQRRQ
jgi:hypothetical protein